MHFIILVCALIGFPGGPFLGHTEATPQAIPSIPELDGGVLKLRPERPRPAQGIDVVYKPMALLAGEPQLHLRARLRTAIHGSYNSGMGSRTVAVLHPQDDGTYRGTFSLPEEVVYAAFAVENLKATDVDSREGQFWEVLVHDDDGHPLFEALRQRFNDHMGRNELVVLETARTMARYYPDRPAAWTVLRAAEGWVLGEEGAEERAATHQEKLLEFDRAFEGREDLSPDEVGYLYWYARGELRDRWRTRLLTDHPGHFFSVPERIAELRRKYPEDPRALLSELEGLWEVALDNEARTRIIGPAFAVARQAGDAAEILAWASRWGEVDPLSELSAAIALVTVESTKEDGIRLLGRMVEEMLAAADEDRSLGATVSGHRETVSRRVASLRKYLGEALVDVGRMEEGVAVLEQAAAVGWETGRFRSLGEALFSAGDQAGALRNFAAVAADPGTSEEMADTLRTTSAVEPGFWDAAVATAQREMLRRTLSEASDDVLPSIHVLDRDGSSVALQDHFGENATVVVIWSRYCGGSNQAMPRVVALAEMLRAKGVQLLAVTRNPIGEAEAFLQEQGWDLQVLFDTQGETARALNSWGTPQYFVLDGNGLLRFAFSSLDDIQRQVEALVRGERGP